MKNIGKLILGLYVGIACLMLVFQAYIRVSQCAGTATCALSIGKRAIWSAAWPASWAGYAYGQVNGGEHAALDADQAAKVAVDAEWYLSQYPDVRAAIQDGRVKSAEEHYRTNGFKEKRLPTKPKVAGPRILGETYELRALPHTKNTLVDHLKAFASGFGGDPNNVAKLDFSKGKLYDFSGLFRRDRQYFDYNLLGNPNLPPGQSIPIGPAAAPTGSYAWPQVTQSPFMFNTVRRMTDTKLTLLPLSKVTFRVGYSQNVFQGPSLSPSGYQVAGAYDLLLQEYQRNSTDDWTASVEWKPVSRTRLTYEEQITHYKGDSNFSMAPQYFNLQEANGYRVAVLQNYDNPINKPVGITCNAGVGADKIYPAQTPNGLPIVDPACNVITSYSRFQPTRVIFPTEILRLQSSSIKDVTMNGNVRYTNANMSLPNYYDDFQGLAGTSREITYAGNARAKREAIAADYGVTWQVLKKLSISEQIDYSNVHQPGVANMTSLTTVTSATPNINSTTLTTTVAGKGTSTFEGSPSVATPQFNFFGQKFITNNLTAAYDLTDRTTFTLTYHYQQHTIGEGAANPTGSLSVS